MSALGRLLLAASAVALVAALPCAVARAQAPSACVDEGPVRGTVPVTTMFGAFDRIAQIYGAVSSAERHIFPALSRAEHAFGFAYDTTGVLGASRVPLCDINSRGVQSDLATGGLGLGYRMGWFSLFYVGSSTWLSFMDAAPHVRIIGSTGFPILGALASPLAPFIHKVDAERFSVSADFIAGAGLYLGPLNLNAGYVASNGLYLSFDVAKVRLFGMGAATDGLDRLPYLKLGVGSLDWIFGDELTRTIGSTTIYARRIQYRSLPSSLVPRDDVVGTSAVLFENWTAHLEQTKIGGVLDLRAAMLVKPTVDLYEATAGITFTPEDWGFDVRVSGGVMRVPPMTFYGSSGGLLPRAEVRLGTDATGVVLGLNDADVLAVFPFATSSIYVRFVLSTAINTEDGTSADRP